MIDLQSAANSEATIVSLEERKFLQETALANKQIELREREVTTKEIELRRSRWLNPTTIGLFAATLGLFGNLIVALINANNSESVQRFKSQSDLIVAAVRTGDAASACTNLISFLKLGLLDDPSGTIGKCETALNTIPVLPVTGTYTPPSGLDWGKEMVPVVKATESGNNYHFEVTFTVPDPKLRKDKVSSINVIKVYAYQIDDNGNRISDTHLPDIQGNWTPGDRVTFSVDLPKSYINDPHRNPYLRFCIGSDTVCLLGPNLVLRQSQ